MTTKTPNYGLVLNDYNRVTWHDDERDNFVKIDASLASVGAVLNILGIWTNSISVSIGDRYIDEVDGKVYESNEAHTTPATGTFAADRQNNPSRWTIITTIQNPGTTGTTIYTVEMVGLAADGVTDDAPTLSAHIAGRASLNETATYVLKSPTNQPILLKSAVDLATNITVIFETPVLLGKEGRLRARGDEKEEGAQAQLESVAVAGQNVIPLRKNHDDSLASRFVIGDAIVVRGLGGGPVTLAERQELIVTAVDTVNNTITVNKPLAYNYQPIYDRQTYPLAQEYYDATGQEDRTYIAILTAAALQGDGIKGSRVVTVDGLQVGRLTAGDFVLLVDDKTVEDDYPTAVDDTNQIHRSVNRILSISGNDVTLTDPLTWTVESAYNAKLSVIDEVDNAHIQGVEVLFLEDPDTGSQVRPIELSLCTDSVITGCIINTAGQLYSHAGSFFRLSSCYNCVIEGCFGADPKHTASGEGYIYDVKYSTQCVVRNCVATRGRHNYTIQGSQRCVVHSCVSNGGLTSDIDFHGINEVQNHVYDMDVYGTTQDAEGTTTHVGIKFGNTSHISGCHDNVVENVRLRDFVDANDRGVQILPPSSGNIVKNISGRNVDVALFGIDLAIDQTLQAANNQFINFSFVECNQAINIRSYNYGSTIDVFAGLIIDGFYARDVNERIYVEGTSGLVLTNSNIEGGFANNQNCVQLLDCPGAQIYKNIIKTGRRGFRLNGGCTDAYIKNNILTLGDGETTVIQDDGTNDNFEYTHNLHPGNDTPTIAGQIISPGRVIELTAGSPTPSLVTVASGTYTLDESNSVDKNILIRVDGAATLQVGQAQLAGYKWHVLVNTTGVVTVTTEGGGGTVNGVASVEMNTFDAGGGISNARASGFISVQSNSGTAPVVDLEGETKENAWVSGHLFALSYATTYTDGGTIPGDGIYNFDWQNGSVQRVTLNTNLNNIIVANLPVAGISASFKVYILQDGTGNRQNNLPANFKFTGSKTFSTGGGAIDTLDMETYDAGATWFCEVKTGYA